MWELVTNGDLLGVGRCLQCVVAGCGRAAMFFRSDRQKFGLRELLPAVLPGQKRGVVNSTGSSGMGDMPVEEEGSELWEYSTQGRKLLQEDGSRVAMQLKDFSSSWLIRSVWPLVWG